MFNFHYELFSFVRFYVVNYAYIETSLSWQNISFYLYVIWYAMNALVEYEYIEKKQKWCLE